MKNNLCGKYMSDQKHKQTFRTMKLTTLALFASACSIYAAESLPQSANVSIHATRQTTKEVISEIEKQTDYLFVYNENEVNMSRSVSVSVKDKPVSEVLNILFEDTNISYQLSGKNISLIVNQPNDVQQNNFVKGVVVDENGTPVIGANVLVKGTTNGTITDMDGNFSLNAKKGDVLLVTYIGYSKFEIKVGNQKSFTITLREDSKALEEVVVVGYGTQKKGSVATSIATVKSDKIINRSVKTVGEALQGQVPGLKIVNNAQPGVSPSIQLRGQASLKDAGTPLVLVDGVPTDFNFLNPEDIESVSVLKDAASSAIYGSRAANGVLLITTKHGKTGKPKFRYNGSFGINTPSNMPKAVGSVEFAKLRNQAERYMGRNPIYSEDDIAKFASGEDPIHYPNETHWMDYVIKNAFTTRHSIEASGGSENIKYLISAGYDHQTGVFPRHGQDTYNVRSATDINITKKFDISFDFRYQMRDRSSIDRLAAKYTYLQSGEPTMIAYYPDGSYGYNNQFNTNPLVPIFEGGQILTDMHEASGIFKFNYKIIDGLKFTGIANVRYNFDLEEKQDRMVRYYNPETKVELTRDTNNYRETRRSNAYYNLQALLSYDKKFGDHSLNVLTGYQQENEKNSWLMGSRSNYPTDLLWQLNAGPKDKWENGGTATHWALASFIARVNYDYKNKYILSASMRSDASSRFSKENRWATFPSAAIAWRISSEPFMKKTSHFLDDLKLRASWGKTGSQTGLGLYPSYTLVNIGGTILGNSYQQSAALGSLGNSELSWEHSDMINIGIDARLFKSRLSLTAEYYIKNTRDILLDMPVPLEYGFGNPKVNVGELRNKGWELSLSWNDRINDFTYGISANVSNNKNKVIDLGDVSVWKGGRTWTEEGKPINMIYGYESMGFFQSDDEVKNAPFQHSYTGAGDIRYKDQLTIDTNNDGIPDKADGKINGDDRVILGDPAPHYLYGFNFNFGYKNFDLGLMFQGIGQQDRIINDNYVRPMYNTTIMEHQLDCWTPENRNAKYPRMLYKDDSNHNYQYSDFWMINAGYLRLKDLTVGYTLPKQILDYVGLEKVRLYFTANNLLTISNFVTGMDPESASGRTYPFCRTYSFGLNVQF